MAHDAAPELYKDCFADISYGYERLPVGPKLTMPQLREGGFIDHFKDHFIWEVLVIRCLEVCQVGEFSYLSSWFVLAIFHFLLLTFDFAFRYDRLLVLFSPWSLCCLLPSFSPDCFAFHFLC